MVSFFDRKKGEFQFIKHAMCVIQYSKTKKFCHKSNSIKTKNQMEAKVSNLTNLETIKLFECHLTTKRRTNLNVHVHDVKHCLEKLFLPLFQLFCLAGQRQPIIYIFHYPSVRNVAKQVVVKQIRMSQIFDHHLPNRPNSPTVPTAPVYRMMA